MDGDHRPANRGERAAVTGQGYLTAGIASRIAELEAAIELLDRVGMEPRKMAVTGAEVWVELEDGDQRGFLILPGGDGSVLDELRVISPQSPVARALYRLEPGDEATLPAGAVEVVRVDESEGS